MVPPSGGPRDLQPPQITNVSPPCGTKPQKEIIITFDEPIITHPQGKILLHPTTGFKHKVKRNKLFIYIDSLLDSSFLYLNMVNFVRDLTEGNIRQTFACLWHTYDTVYVPKIKVIRMPFDDSEPFVGFVASLKDSAGKTLLYYSQKGELPKLPEGTYDLTIWQDRNNNLKFDYGEFVGSNTIHVPQEGKDTILISSQSPRISVKTISTISARLIINIGGWDSVSMSVPFVQIGDTIITQLADSPRQIRLELYGKWDTAFTVLLPSCQDTIAHLQISQKLLKNDTAQYSWLTLSFPAPVINQEDSIIAIVKDSINKIKVYWASPLQAIVFLAKNSEYDIPSGQFNLKWGKLADDTIHIITKQSWTKCSTFIVGNQTQQPVLVKTGKISFWLSAGSPTLSFQCFPSVPVSIYILKDRNRDGRWNNGNYRLFIPPERLLKLKSIKLEPNWEHREIIKEYETTTN